MSTLMLIRMTPLTEDEVSRLPHGCRPVYDSPSVVARADIDIPLTAAFKLAVAMGRAIPDAQFAFHEMTAPGAKGLFKSAMHAHIENGIPSAEDAIVEDVFEESEEEISWWDLTLQKDFDGARAILSELPLTVEDRTRLRAMFRSPEVDQVIAVCKWARELKWQSFVIPLRNLFSHSNATVREQAVCSVGVLAGPSMIPAVHLLRTDKSAKVRTAAAKAVLRMKG
jgi:hypothetical protein